jgi:hypothetical protein
LKVVHLKPSFSGKKPARQHSRADNLDAGLLRAAALSHTRGEGANLFAIAGAPPVATLLPPRVFRHSVFESRTVSD